MSDNTKQVIINVFISSIWLIIWWYVLYLIIGFDGSVWPTIPVWTWGVTWGVVVVNTWEVIERPIRDISLTPIQNVENILHSGHLWKDYVVLIPEKQPNITSKDGAKNTEIMHNYLSYAKYDFIIPAGKNWYLMIITSKPVANNRDLFLWIRWLTVWLLDKDKSLPTDDNRKYLFSMNSLPVSDYKYWISLFDKSISWKIQLNAFVAEKDNSIEKIIMIFY